jgi:hypothetical protein
VSNINKFAARVHRHSPNPSYRGEWFLVHENNETVLKGSSLNRWFIPSLRRVREVSSINKFAARVHRHSPNPF